MSIRQAKKAHLPPDIGDLVLSEIVFFEKCFSNALGQLACLHMSDFLMSFTKYKIDINKVIQVGASYYCSSVDAMNM